MVTTIFHCLKCGEEVAGEFDKCMNCYPPKFLADKNRNELIIERLERKNNEKKAAAEAEYKAHLEQQAKAERARRLDMFAAAALTGIVSKLHHTGATDPDMAMAAWRYAAAMLGTEQPGE